MGFGPYHTTPLIILQLHEELLLLIGQVPRAPFIRHELGTHPLLSRLGHLIRVGCAVSRGSLP